MMNSEYIYTRKEFANQLGISRECLRTRMRRGRYMGWYIRGEDGKFLFKKQIWESEVKPKRKINRGAHDDAVRKGRYPNKGLEEHNRMKKFLAARKQLSKKELAMVPAILEQIKNANLKNHVVYFISYFDPLMKDKDRLIKIGKTKERTVTGRFSSIQSSSPLELTLITYCKSKTEEFFHEKFREHWVRGEWFKYTPVIDYLKNEYEGEYCLPEELLNTMKSNVDGQWLDYISEYSDQELCDLWFKLKTNKIN